MSYSRAVRRRAGERDPEIAFASLLRWEAGAILAWIMLSMEKGTRVYKYASSYGLKHACEHALDYYVSNDCFKGAMLVAGHPPVDGVELNWMFRIKPASGRRTLDHYRTGIGVDRDRLDPQVLALYDSIVSWSYLNVMFDNLKRHPDSRPIVREEDRQVFREARRRGLVGHPRISPEIYCAVTGDCRPPSPRRCA